MCQGFNQFSVFFASFCIGKISHQQHKGWYVQLTICTEQYCSSGHFGIIYPQDLNQTNLNKIKILNVLEIHW